MNALIFLERKHNSTESQWLLGAFISDLGLLISSYELFWIKHYPGKIGPMHNKDCRLQVMDRGAIYTDDVMNDTHQNG